MELKEFQQHCANTHESLNLKLDNIIEKLDMLNDVTISNGGGRKVTYTRQDFVQMVYDRINFRGVYTKAAAIMGFIFTVTMIINIIRTWK